jgi:hypothetical protein
MSSPLTAPVGGCDCNPREVFVRPHNLPHSSVAFSHCRPSSYSRSHLLHCYCGGSAGCRRPRFHSRYCRVRVQTHTRTRQNPCPCLWVQVWGLPVIFPTRMLTLEARHSILPTVQPCELITVPSLRLSSRQLTLERSTLASLCSMLGIRRSMLDIVTLGAQRSVLNARHWSSTLNTRTTNDGLCGRKYGKFVSTTRNIISCPIWLTARLLYRDKRHWPGCVAL